MRPWHCPELWVPHPWRYPRLWVGFWETWPGEGQPVHGVGWNWMGFKVISKLSHSVIHSMKCLLNMRKTFLPWEWSNTEHVAQRGLESLEIFENQLGARWDNLLYMALLTQGNWTSWILDNLCNIKVCLPWCIQIVCLFCELNVNTAGRFCFSESDNESVRESFNRAYSCG